MIVLAAAGARQQRSCECRGAKDGAPASPPRVQGSFLFLLGHGTAHCDAPPTSAGIAWRSAANSGITCLDAGRAARLRAAAAAGIDGSLPAVAAAASGPAAVDIAIEHGPNNSRCIWAGVDVAAPTHAVYAALTAYEALGSFIPGTAPGGPAAGRQR